ncbi:universal stress protein [Salinarchaeum laminariae]|uniref:universal stress protein n=1 Tax=Salinarchaeum laminariae TaxID=869888 RepID=UPI0020BD702C|nr:universal stress protein [Salinarchaeum laminariae]
MRYLAAVDTVHTAAAVSDYLGRRLGVDDEVVAVTVHATESDAAGEDAGAVDASTADTADAATPTGFAVDSTAERDGLEALNVIGVRLAVPEVDTVERLGDVAAELLDAASTFDVDEIVLGRRAGTMDSAEESPEAGLELPEGELGSTAAAVLAGADRPVVVLPSVGD